MANEENTSEEVVKDTTPFSWDDVPSGGDFKLVPEATLLAHLAAITIERDIKDNFNEGKTFIGYKAYLDIDIDSNVADGNLEADDVKEESLEGESFIMSAAGNFHQKLSFNDKAKFMDFVKIVTQNTKLNEDMIKEQGEQEFFDSLLGKPVYVDIVHKVGKTDATKKYANIAGISKAVKCPSKEYEAFKLNEKYTKNQCAVYTV